MRSRETVRFRCVLPHDGGLCGRLEEGAVAEQDLHVVEILGRRVLVGGIHRLSESLVGDRELVSEGLGRLGVLHDEEEENKKGDENEEEHDRECGHGRAWSGGDRRDGVDVGWNGGAWNVCGEETVDG